MKLGAYDYTESSFTAHREIMEAVINNQTGTPLNTYADGPAHGQAVSESLWIGGVLSREGKVIFVPSGGGRVGIYDPVANSFALGASHTEVGSAAFFGGLLLDDGRILFIPEESVHIGLYDSANDVYTSGPAHGEGGGGQAFRGGIQMKNGLVLLSPADSLYIGLYNPVTNTYARGPAHGEGGDAFCGAMVLPNGKILLTPANSNYYGIYDSDTNTYTRSNPVSTNEWASGCSILPNGNVVTAPWSRPYIYTFKYDDYLSNLARGSEALVNIFLQYSLIRQETTFGVGSNHTVGSALMPDGRVIFAPRNFGNIITFDPKTNVVTLGPAIAGTEKFSGAVSIPNGKVVLVPRRYTHVGLYTPLSGGQAFPEELLKSKYMNCL